jgi:protein SCO1
MNRHIILLLISIIILALAGCAHRAGNAQRYELKGTVVSIDRRGETITVAHQEIPGYMEAMAMPFKPKDNWVLDQAQPGNRIQATLVVDGLRSWLEDVVITQETTDNAAPASNPEPQPGDAVADFTLTDQDGKRIRLGDYRGRALVVTFIYTRCPVPDYCPLMTNHFAAISRALKDDAALYEATHLLSVTVDPEYDTPKVLREYGAKYMGATDFSHWTFATGKPDEVKKVATGFGLQYWPEGGQIVHSLRTAVIAPDGRLVKLYRGNDWQPAEIVADLQGIKAAAASGAKVYYGVGVVESINEPRTTVEINHEDIKDLMPAMSMPFEVKSPALLEQIAPGDRVSFTVEEMPHGLVIIELRKR